jgi:murein L,D-transpeptidase YcbB/YkuD
MRTICPKRNSNRGLVALAAVCSAVGLTGAAQRLPPPDATREVMVSAATEQGLLKAIGIYESAAAAGGWPPLPTNKALRAGDDDPAVALLRRRLQLTGEHPPGRAESTVFDPTLDAAVLRFQVKNGLEPNGVVYGITARALNVPAQTRLNQLRVNLARVQELLPKLAAPRYVLVNTASFEVQGVANGRVEVTSRTIVGKRQTPTPVVSATIQAVNILPFWHVPPGIAGRAIIPAVRKDPSYLARERIRVFSTFGGEEIAPELVNWWGPESSRYVFRQEPGPQNALGVLRIDMPNKYIVYMHDTPMKKLFGEYERAFSAGCVRVETVLDVASWLLAGQGGWTREAIDQNIADGKAKTIKLPAPVPVHFAYLTALVRGGEVHFRNDLYNRDEGAPTADPVDPSTMAQGWQTLVSGVAP